MRCGADAPEVTRTRPTYPVPLEEARSTRSLRNALASVLGVVALATASLMYTEGWSVWNAFFFTLISVTTVGYSSEGISEAGRAVTAVVLVVGIGAV